MHTSSMALKRIGFVVVAIFFITGSVLAFNFPGFGGKETVTAANGVVSVPATQVSDGKAHFYLLADGGKEIAFFVVKGSDGAFHVAFDACDACFKEKKGYSQQGDLMICGNCNMKFAINRIGRDNHGGCNPGHLDFTLSGGNLIVKAADLKAGTRFF
ncbi:MAG: DUF2318 domain-containing protein [Desulfuromonas sp.]|nr:DUF2318 domain-containing protein [Desulfuromonas sp.]